MKAHDFYDRQKYLFAAVFIVVSIPALLLLNYNASRIYKQSWIEMTSLALATQASDHRALIDQFLETHEDQLASMMVLFNPEALGNDRQLATVFESMKRTRVITDLGVIDRNGRHLAYQGPFKKELDGRNYAQAPWFGEVMKSGRYVSDVFSGYRKVPHLIVAVTDAGKTWILRATINSDLFNDLVARANVGPGGDAFIVNRLGELQTPSRIGRTRLSAEDMAFYLDLANEGGKARQTDDRLITATYINSGQWLLVLETHMDTSLAAYREARHLNNALVALASLIIILVSVLITRTMVGSLAHAEHERAQLTSQMREMDKMALIGRLSASVSHEINNPLQIVSDQAGLMDELLEDETPHHLVHFEDYRQAIGKIRTQVRRTNKITRRLLGFSHKQDSDRCQTDINQTVEETVGLFEYEARRHRITITNHYQEGLPQVVTDPAQLQQVFLNVLHNAMDAIGEDGSIDITSRIENDYIAVDFADSGPGLPLEVMEHLYDPFFTTKPKGKGTGLGLYVSRDVMVRLGGALTAGNREGGGAVFSIYLPLREVDQKRTEPSV
jgi:two-component system NtrC family sensor kinase